MTDHTLNPIQIARLGQGLDVPEAAELAELHPDTLRRWERGDVEPKVELFWKLANVLCAEPNTLWSDLKEWLEARNAS